jgi:hypothetical protein
MFNDLWAISADGKTWVQLTDFSATWQFADDVAKMPFLCADVKNCSLGCQYVATTEYPYDAYSCSAKNQPPPAMGLMRPVVGNAAGGALVPIAFGERVGLSADYTWGGPLQLAMADMAFVDQLPALIDYRTNLTPTPRDPAGDTLWSNPGGDTTIGTGYEPWAFSAGNVSLGIASDAFQKTTAPTSAAFTDVLTWQWQGTPSLKDVTAFGPRYPYAPNGAPTPINTYGQWEEPMVYSLGANPAFIAFGSSADLNPPWNPLRHASTFGLETWILRTDGSAAPAIKLTHLNDGKGGNKLAYPTAYDPGDNSLYLSVVPAGGTGGANPAGIVYKIKVPEF